MLDKGFAHEIALEYLGENYTIKPVYLQLTEFNNWYGYDAPRTRIFIGVASVQFSDYCVLRTTFNGAEITCSTAAYDDSYYDAALDTMVPYPGTPVPLARMPIVSVPVVANSFGFAMPSDLNQKDRAQTMYNYPYGTFIGFEVNKIQ